MYSTAQLLGMKRSVLSVESVKAKFEWARPGQLIRLGGFYTTAPFTRIWATAGFPNDMFTLNDNSVGLQELSFHLRDATGNVLAGMTDNYFEATPPRLYDIQVDTGGTKIKIKVKKSEVVLDLWSSRVTLETLEEMLVQDWKAWIIQRDRMIKENPNFRTWQEFADTSDPKNILAYVNNPKPGPWPQQSIPEASQKDHLEKVLEGVKTSALKYSLDDDGRIMVLNFNHLVTFDDNRKIEIRNGVDIAGSGQGFGCVMLGNA